MRYREKGRDVGEGNNSRGGSVDRGRLGDSRRVVRGRVRGIKSRGGDWQQGYEGETKPGKEK